MRGLVNIGVYGRERLFHHQFVNFAAIFESYAKKSCILSKKIDRGKLLQLRSALAKERLGNSFSPIESNAKWTPHIRF